LRPAWIDKLRKREETDMSISALANAAIARRPDFLPQNRVPQGLGEIAKAFATAPKAAGKDAAAGQEGDDAGGGSKQIETALNVLFGYIPSEILTLYVAVLAAVHKPDTVTVTDWITFWSFLVATPIVVWLVYGAKVIAAKRPVPLAFGAWPVWEMFAATLAYCAWAFALPKSPFSQYSDTWYSAALSGVAVLVVSTFLGLLAPFFQRPLKVKTT
jgi:hypothetical protein